MHSRLTNLLAGILVVLLTGEVLAAELPARKSSIRGVAVTVTPQGLSDTAANWDFKIVLDTHSGDLSDDLTKTAVLVDGGGKRYTPAAWEGAGPGGHHRAGVLRFKPISPRPASIEIHITRSGEPAPRVLRWQLK